MLARALLILTLLLPGLRGLGDAAAACAAGMPRPADPCGAACCCAGVCPCAAPNDAPDPEPADPVVLPTHLEAFLPADEIGLPTPPASPVAGFTAPDLGAPRAPRVRPQALLCVWRT